MSIEQSYPIVADLDVVPVSLTHVILYGFVFARANSLVQPVQPFCECWELVTEIKPKTEHATVYVGSSSLHG